MQIGRLFLMKDTTNPLSLPGKKEEKQNLLFFVWRLYLNCNSLVGSCASSTIWFYSTLYVFLFLFVLSRKSWWDRVFLFSEFAERNITYWFRNNNYWHVLDAKYYIKICKNIWIKGHPNNTWHTSFALIHDFQFRQSVQSEIKKSKKFMWHFVLDSDIHSFRLFPSVVFWNKFLNVCAREWHFKIAVIKIFAYLSLGSSNVGGGERIFGIKWTKSQSYTRSFFRLKNKQN